MSYKFNSNVNNKLKIKINKDTLKLIKKSSTKTTVCQTETTINQVIYQEAAVRDQSKTKQRNEH